MSIQLDTTKNKRQKILQHFYSHYHEKINLKQP